MMMVKDTGGLIEGVHSSSLYSIESFRNEIKKQ